MLAAMRWSIRGLIPFCMLFLCVLAQASCTCTDEPAASVASAVIACKPRGSVGRPAPPIDPATKTVVAGTIPGGFSTTSAGTARYALSLTPVPARMTPDLGVVYDSESGGSGVLGVGFSLTGASAISRCASNRAVDQEVRDVRFDAEDKLCLDGRRLVPVGEEPGIVEYRTLPDMFVRVIGHFPPDATEKTPNNALFFEAHLPNGRVITYGADEGSRPLARGGVPRAFLATKLRDGRGNGVEYAYCHADDADGSTAEYALVEVRYTSFEGPPAREPDRAVRFVYGAKDPEDIHVGFTHGMRVQSSLQLDEVQMIGPAETLVRRYDFSYEQSPTTRRTLLTAVEECAADNACKPPTRFQYKSDAPGFRRITTSLPAPTSDLASPLIFDLDGDGLDDLVVPDTNPALSTPSHPITEWKVAHNRGPGASPPYFSALSVAFSEEWPMVADPSAPADPAKIQPELGTALDYDDDGRMDLLLHEVYGITPNFTVLMAQPDKAFKALDTGIARPFPLGATVPPPALTTPGASVHLADLDGDGMPDRIQCEDHGVDASDVPGEPIWQVHLWKPANAGEPAGFEASGTKIDQLEGYSCETHLHTVDLNADGKTELVVPSILKLGGTGKTPKLTYSALSRRSDGSFEVFDTKLPVQHQGGRTVFLDANGDGLPDAVESGFSDYRLRTYINTGAGFSGPVNSLKWDGIGGQDAFFHLATPIDFDADGRQDLLMPIDGGVAPNVHSTLPGWFVLRATGASKEPTFVAVDAGIPFEPELSDAIRLADPRGPRIGDLNGDGAADVVLVIGGVFNVFENVAADQDVLVGVADGMNGHEQNEPGFIPSVRVSYGHLTDGSITDGKGPGDPAREGYLYLSRLDPANDCDYPRRCAVGHRRVVSGYELSDGEGGQRRFGVRYRDGRYHRLGLGDLGFGERIVTDLDTGAGTAEFYDNRTFIKSGVLGVFPFAGQATKVWRWYPPLPGQPKPGPIELVFVDSTPAFSPTNDGATYFTIPTKERIRREQGVYPSPQDPSMSVEAYVADVESKGGATMLRDTTTTASKVDGFGNVLEADVGTVGVDLTSHVERTFKNDTDRWVLGQLQTQKECSSASMQSRCRLLTRTTTIFGEVEKESISSDDPGVGTKLDIVYGRDDFGNVTSTTATDAYGHVRSSSSPYDAEGMFPLRYVNGAEHVTVPEFDARFGVLTKLTDPNGLVTERRVDSFGRITLERRPDGSQTTMALARTKDGGPKHDAYRVTKRTTTTGGADDLVAFDELGRPVLLLDHGPDTDDEQGAPPRRMQVIGYDRLSGKVARRTVPIREDTPDASLLFDEYTYDALGREVRHVTPWKAATLTAYKGFTTEVRDPLLNVTSIEQDALDRPVTITDAMKGTTKYTYGPFGTLYTVEDPGGAVMRTTRDAYGRVTKLEDPDRGTTTQDYDGFGELFGSLDALGRTITFEYDVLGRTKTRIDKKGAEVLTTTWTWDTAVHGLGRLHKLTSPDGEKSFGYNARGQLESITLAVTGEAEELAAGFTYDDVGRVSTIAYPSPNGAAPFAVTQDYDEHGYMIAVRDSAMSAAYWRLTGVDEAGRFRAEAFGNGAVTERSYYPDKQALKSITTDLVTNAGTTKVQRLSYAYDARLDLLSRTDALQPQYTVERFRHDALQRVTCAYFNVNEDPNAPCALSYGYAPNGNLTSKSDVGVLSYNDPAHPHAVTGAGGDSFAYNLVGDQIARPGGAAVSYTPFDLPKSITEGAMTVSFGYSGDQQRIRKTTPTEETLYFGDLYERVKKTGSGTVEHRYSIHSPERVIAVVTRGGSEPGTRYLHVDHLGSVDALTDASKVVERRSYDPFGQRRNPIWGQPPPASFTSKTTKGFTGHDTDEELGLVNAKGRIYDPRLGRFLTIDPMVSNLWHSQSLNAYAYVRNRPLSLIDPSGFTGEIPSGASVDPDQPGVEVGPDGALEIVVHSGKPSSSAPGEAQPAGAAAAEAGAGAPSKDVGTTGSSPVEVPQGVILVPNENVVPNSQAPDVGDAIDPSMPTIDQAPPDTFDAWLGRVVRLEEPPDEIGLYWIAYSIRHDFVDPVRRWVAPEPQLYLDSDHHVRASSIPRDHTDDMVPVLGGITLILLPEAEGLKVVEDAAATGVRVGGEAWKAFEPGAKACQNGCEAVAKAIQNALGGDIKVIRPPPPGQFLGRVRNSVGKFVNPAGDLAPGWSAHHVVVGDGMVYDAFTGPNGMAASAYKELWEYGDVLDFGF